MDVQYPLRSLARLRVQERCTIVGKVTTQGPNYVVLTDSSATAKVTGLPPGIENWVEVRGEVGQDGVVIASGYTVISGEVDIEVHLKIAEMYEKVSLVAS